RAEIKLCVGSGRGRVPTDEAEKRSAGYCVQPIKRALRPRDERGALLPGGIECRRPPRGRGLGADLGGSLDGSLLREPDSVAGLLRVLDMTDVGKGAVEAAHARERHAFGRRSYVERRGERG